MYKTYYFLDSENISPEYLIKHIQLSGINTENSIIFVIDNSLQNTVDAGDIRLLNKYFKKVKIHKEETEATDGMDMVLVTLMSLQMRQTQKKEFIIISNDKGFQDILDSKELKRNKNKVKILNIVGG